MRSTPVPRTATVFPLAAIAPRCAAVSTPRARPLKITDPARRQIAGQPLGHSGAVRSRMAGADQGNAGLSDHACAAPYIKDQRRIVNLLKLCGIRGIVKRDHRDFRARRFRDFIVRQFQRSSRAERLGGDGLNTGGFSSVREAWKRASTPPKYSTKRRARPAPSPGVRARASHSKACPEPVSSDVAIVCSTKPPRMPQPRTVAGWQNRVKGSRHMALLESNNSMRRLRISAISYLNTAPLMWDFEHGNAGRDLRFPTRCHRIARRLCARRRRTSASFQRRRIQAFRA